MGRCRHCASYKRTLELQEIKRINSFPQKLLRLFSHVLDKLPKGIKVTYFLQTTIRHASRCRLKDGYTKRSGSCDKWIPRHPQWAHRG